MNRLLLVCALVCVACEAPDQGTVAPPEAQIQASTPAAPKPLRIVAMGDVHGDHPALVRALKAAKLVNDDLTWSGGETVLVQTGDLLDRGETEREVVDLMLQLRKEAPDKGGRVILLNGNHELMNAMGDLRYVTPAAMHAFDDAVPERDRDRFKDAPKDIRGRLAAWSPGGVYAKRLAPDGIIAVVDGNVFVHGGVLPEHAERMGELNESVTDWLTHGGAPPREVVANDRSPVWTREYSRPQPSPEACQALSRALGTLKARRMFVGHTPQIKPGPNAVCNGGVWRIDAGMSAHYGGEAAVVEIVGDSVRVLK